MALKQNNLAESTTELGFPAETNIPLQQEVTLEDGTKVMINGITPAMLATKLGITFKTPGEPYTTSDGTVLTGVCQKYNDDHSGPKIEPFDIEFYYADPNTGENILKFNLHSGTDYVGGTTTNLTDKYLKMSSYTGGDPSYFKPNEEISDTQEGVTTQEQQDTMIETYTAMAGYVSSVIYAEYLNYYELLESKDMIAEYEYPLPPDGDYENESFKNLLIQLNNIIISEDDSDTYAYISQEISVYDEDNIYTGSYSVGDFVRLSPLNNIVNVVGINDQGDGAYCSFNAEKNNLGTGKIMFKDAIIYKFDGEITE